MLGGSEIKIRSKRHLIYFRYLRALCHRVNLDFKKSSKDYKELLKCFECEEGVRLAKHIFIMILMPSETDRKKLIYHVNAFKNLLELYEEDKDRRVLSPFYIKLNKNDYTSDNKNLKWLDKKYPDVLKIT
jgi:hypothetical protein